MKVIAVSGGVACGKSRFVRCFADQAGIGQMGVINCDEIVSELYQEASLIEEIDRVGRSSGHELLDLNGGLKRGKLRELLFDNSNFRGRIEQVVHPLVFQRVTSRLSAFSELVRMTFVEVPLLYEVAFPLKRDLDLVVAASGHVQYRRLLEDRELEPALAERILCAQMPVEEKIRKADIVVWNDGSLPALEAQIDHLFQRCETIFN